MMCNVRARASHDSHLSPPPFPTLRPFDVPPSFRDVIDSFSRLIATAEAAAAAATVAAAGQTVAARSRDKAVDCHA